jgi:hypothetical protein
MYCSTHASGNSALEDLALAEKMICQQLTRGTGDGSTTVRQHLSVVEPLLRLTFRYLAPKSSYTPPTMVDGVVYVNPPTESKDYDDAYHEAKRLFVELFGEGEGFLMRDEVDDGDADDELN